MNFKKLFSRKKNVSINSIKFNNLGWQMVEKSDDRIVWLNDTQTAVIAFHFFNIPPDLPTKLENIEEMRILRRQNIVESINGGFIRCNTIQVKGFDILDMIIKQPQEERGYLFLGSFTIPFKNCSYVINIQAKEFGTTGMREAMMGNAFLSGQLKAKSMSELRRDPYDKNFKDGHLMTIFEEEKYDAQFPNHPLSLVRKNLELIKSSLEFGKELENLEKF
jgi:hypothetical protein